MLAAEPIVAVAAARKGTVALVAAKGRKVSTDWKEKGRKRDELDAATPSTAAVACTPPSAPVAAPRTG